MAEKTVLLLVLQVCTPVIGHIVNSLVTLVLPSQCEAWLDFPLDS